MTTTLTTLPIEYWNNTKTRLVSPRDENGREVELGYFYNVQFVGHSIHYPQPLIYSHHTGKLSLPTIEKFMSLGRGTVYEDRMEYECEVKNYNVKYTGEVFYFVYNMANYYHFIYDTLPYLYSYFYEKEYHPDLKLLVSPPEGQDDLYPFVWDTLALLGITKHDVVFLDRKVVYKTVIVGSSLTHNGLSNTPPHKGLRGVINRLEGEYEGAEKVYISRRTWLNPKNENIGTDYTERRRCVNEDEVAEYFISLGFEEVFCENLSMKEKIGLFKGAKVVAGPSGGGMVNTIFCHPKTKVISIDSPKFFEVNKRFEYSMCHNDVHHFTDTEFVGEVEESVDSEGALSISGGMNSPWRVNLNTLKDFVESVDV